MISNLPEGWEEVRLEDVVKFDPRESIKKGTICKKIGMDKLLPFQRKIDGFEMEEFKGGTKFRNGDTLLARITPCLENGKTAQVTIFDKEEIGFGSTEYIVLREKPGISINDFIYYLAISPKVKDVAIKSMTGTSGRQRAQREVIENLIINLPPLHEQRVIADTLSALDDKIELNNKINENLEKQAQAIFKHWFIDFEFPDENGNPYKSSGGEMVESELGMIPRGWEVVEFKNIIEFSNGYGFKSKELLESPVEEGYKVFKMGDIKVGGGLNPNKTKSWISSEYLKGNSLEKYLAKKGDLLMCMTDMKNNMKLLGHTALMPTDGEYVINQRVGHIRGKNEINISYPYLYILTNNDKFIDDLRGRSNSGVQVNLTTSAIKETKIIIGSQNINLHFDRTIRPMIEKIFSLETQSQKLSQLRDTLLPKLMNGELRIPLD